MLFMPAAKTSVPKKKAAAAKADAGVARKAAPAPAAKPARPVTKKAAPKASKTAAAPRTEQRIALGPALAELTEASAEQRIAWVLRHFRKSTVLTSSFGAQSAVLLHMTTQQAPEVPVVLLDTGYLFPETYRFVDELAERLSLNLKVYRPIQSAAWQEARYGKLWEQGLEGINHYNQINKLEPMDRAVRELKAKAWISGVRRGQSEVREKMDVLGLKDGVLRLHPLIDWTDKDIYDYLKTYDLPYHPLWEKGYTSIGDWHTSHAGPDARFFGLKRECGLHEQTSSVGDGGDGDFVI
jgi:phosphoadenosine phosphosulfate reductase